MQVYAHLDEWDDVLIAETLQLQNKPKLRLEFKTAVFLSKARELCEPRCVFTLTSAVQNAQKNISAAGLNGTGKYLKPSQ